MWTARSSPTSRFASRPPSARSSRPPARRSTLPDISPLGGPPLGGHHADVRRLRALLRDREAREADGVFVCEGPRVIAAALDQGVPLIEVFVGVDASPAAQVAAVRAAEAGISVRRLAAGVATKVGATTTPQGIFGI